MENEVLYGINHIIYDFYVLDWNFRHCREWRQYILSNKGTGKTFPTVLTGTISTMRLMASKPLLLLIGFHLLLVFELRKFGLKEEQL